MWLEGPRWDARSHPLVFRREIASDGADPPQEACASLTCHMHVPGLSQRPPVSVIAQLWPVCLRSHSWVHPSLACPTAVTPHGPGYFLDSVTPVRWVYGSGDVRPSRRPSDDCCASLSFALGRFAAPGPTPLPSLHTSHATPPTAHTRPPALSKRPPIAAGTGRLGVIGFDTEGSGRDERVLTEDGELKKVKKRGYRYKRK